MGICCFLFGWLICMPNFLQMPPNTQQSLRIFLFNPLHICMCLSCLDVRERTRIHELQFNPFCVSSFVIFLAFCFVRAISMKGVFRLSWWRRQLQWSHFSRNEMQQHQRNVKKIMWKPLSQHQNHNSHSHVEFAKHKEHIMSATISKRLSQPWTQRRWVRIGKILVLSEQKGHNKDGLMTAKAEALKTAVAFKNISLFCPISYVVIMKDKRFGCL